MNNDQRIEARQRLSALDIDLEEISHRAAVLYEKLKMRRKDMQEPTQADRLYSRLATIEDILVQRFPQYILEFKGAMVIPGLAGGGETGPGGVLFPNYDGGGTLKADPHTRNYHP